MKLSTKIFLPIILISAMLILLNGCTGTVPDEDPGYTPGTTTIFGIIAAPCCSTSSTAVSDAPSDWCLQCEQNWFLQKNIAVILTYEGEEIDSTTTNTQGEYTFTDLSAGENYVITAICPDDGGYPLVKDVVKEVADGEDYDAGMTDCESTALGLIVDALVNLGISSEFIILEDIQSSVQFESFVEAVCEVLESCGDVTSDENLLDQGNLVLMEILGDNPGWTGGEVICVFNPPDDPCIGVPDPTVDAGPNQSFVVCPGANELVDLVGSGSGKGTVAYAWDLDNDGQFDDSTTQNPQDVLFGVGVHPVRLKVTDECGSAIDEMIVTITESEAVTADADGPYGPYEVCPGANALVDLSGSGTGTGALSYDWDLDNDGQYDNSSAQNPQDVPFGVGTHTVGLRVTDDCGSATDSTTVEVTELPALTGATFEGGPIVLCVDQDKDIGSEIIITPEFDGVPGTPMTLDECVNSCGDCTCSIAITPPDMGYFSISGPTNLYGLAEGVGYITITYTYDGPCGLEFVDSDPIEVVVEADAFFLIDNKGGIHGLDINTTSPCIEVVHNANHAFFGVSACIDPETVVEFKYDRSHCGGGVSAYKRVYGGVVDPTMINLCNGDSTYLWIRIGGAGGTEYPFDIYRLGPGESYGVHCP